MNKSFFKSLFLMVAGCFLTETPAALAQLYMDAGTLPNNDKKKISPYVAIDPEKNITNVFPSSEKNNKIETETPEIYFSADELEDNQDLETITASGNVNIIRKNLSLIADKVIYNQKDDIITAVGNVTLVEKDGNVMFSDYVVLSDKMSRGEMQNIKVIMKDETRMAARKVRQLKNKNKILDQVVYSPCNVCQTTDPLWQLKARQVKHDAASQDVYYKDAFLEVKGVPVFYTPFFSHPDPQVTRRTGFLPPKLSSNSYLGAALQPNYFWDISDNEDFLFSPILSSDKGLILGGTYKKYFSRGDFNFSGTIMTDKDNDENRGNLFGTARYEINDFWLADLDINYASDGAYLKDLSLPKKDDAWLTSRARMQGFDNRNYAAIEAYYYKQISSSLIKYDKPYVVPVFTYENLSEPGAYGSYSKTTFDFASVYREQDDSSQRATMINSWVLPYTSPYGEKYRMVASLKSDLYYVDNYLNPQDEIYTGSVGRMMPQVGLEWKLPFVRATESSRQILEPTVVAVAAPNGGNKINKIPNEDSMNIELDDTNVLDLDRYAGYDRNDTGSRVSYGLNWSSYGDITGRSSAFIAQSYYFDSDESFSRSIGTKERFSDYVGRIYANPHKYLDLNYRFRMDKDNFEMQYSELSTSIGPEIFSSYISYIYLQGKGRETIKEGYNERKELYLAFKSKLTKDWSIEIFDRIDLAPNGGTLEYGGNIIYEDECLKLITSLRKYNSNYNEEYDSDGGNYEISFSFLLKTLGGFGSN